MNKKNINNQKLEICSLNPLTGYNRDGYCNTDLTDSGSHLVCAEMDKGFLDFTSSRGNNLRSIVKEKDKWCICQDRYLEAYKNKRAPKVIKNATHKKIKDSVKRAINSSLKRGGKSKKHKNTIKLKKKIRVGKSQRRKYEYHKQI